MINAATVSQNKQKKLKIGSHLMKNILILIFLTVLWLLMSGLYKTLIILLGVFSVFLVTLFVHRMRIKDGYELKANIKLVESIKYFAWLLVEVFKSNWAVSRILISRKIRVSQKFVEVSAEQRSDLARVMFANSITLTPGTVTIETEDEQFLVHILNFTDSTMSELKNMNDKVVAIEK